MSLEVLSSQPGSSEVKEVIDHLEAGHINHLQGALMELYLGDKLQNEGNTQEAVLSWIKEYAARVRNIVDDSDNSEIRKMAREHKYYEAAEVVKELLDKGKRSIKAV